MLRGLPKLTWLEIKIFVREPMGVIGAVALPVIVLLVLGRSIGGGRQPMTTERYTFLSIDAPIFAAILIIFSAVLSLVTIISIYREGGILKRLRATPLTPVTILSAQVIVKLLLTLVTLALMIVVGRRYYPVALDGRIVSFTLALLISSVSILAVGFVIASIVPTARFAQPIGAAILYPMVAMSGLFIPLDVMPPALRALARLVPLTYAVSLMKGTWAGEPWSRHLGDVGALIVLTTLCLIASTRLFRWE
ncbi:MAG TPA: ABC transporter permease [Vicinamibacterales bacterium]|nr:ABC transporter permease [Vicinamibacterales bacterium]